MGGFRQFTSLLRKNLLLKTRRPKATCFEMSLPIVLFLLLVYIRAKVEDKTYGPYTFDHHEIFPMSHTVVRSLLDIDLSTENTIENGMEMGESMSSISAMQNPASMTTSEVDDLSKQLKDMLGDALCGSVNWDSADSVLTTIVGEKMAKDLKDAVKEAEPEPEPEPEWNIRSALETALAWKIDNKTIANHLHTCNPSHTGEQARRAVVDLQSWNVSGWIKELDHQRQKYLSGDWPQVLMDTAKRVDKEIKLLSASIDVNPSNGHTRQIAEKWVDDFCSLHLLGYEEHVASWNALNASRLAKELGDFRDLLDTSGITSWVNNANASELWKDINLSVQSVFDFDIVRTTNQMMDEIRGSDADSLVEFMDEAAVALSYFVKSRSTLAKILGERPQEDMNWQSMSWDGAKAMSGFNTTLYDGLHTQMGHALYERLIWLQNDPSVTQTIKDERDKLVQEWHDSGAEEALENLVAELNKFLDDVRHHDLTDIENIVLPKFSQTWKVECTKLLNRTKVGNTFEDLRSEQLYKDLVRDLAKKNLTHEVSLFHEHLATWNVSDAFHELENLYDRFRKEVNATEVGDFIQRTMGDAQQIAEDLAQQMKDHDVNVDQTSLNATEVKRYAHALHNLTIKELGKHFDQCKHPSTRRLQSQYDDFFQELQNRKVLIAPYKGEVKDMLNYMFVEFAFSVTGEVEAGRRGEIPEFLEEFLALPPTRAIVSKVAEWFLKERLVTFESEEALEKYALDNSNDVLMAIVFRNADPATGAFPTGQFKVDYSIRAHAQFLPQTSKILRIARNAVFGGVRRSFYPYIELYFAHIQEIMGRSVARMRASRGVKAEVSDATVVNTNIAASERTIMARRLSMGLQQYPANQYTVDRFIRIIQHTMPMFLILGWIYAVSLLVKEIVYEKQERLRDVMRIQGLKTWVYWSSWMTSAMIQNTLLVAVFTLLLSGGGVLRNSDPLLIFFFFEIYGLASVSFAMLISSFFSRAKVAAACGGLAYYVSYLPYSVFNRYEDVMSIHGKNTMCLLSGTGMGIGSAIIAKWELIGEGVNWSNFASPPPVTNSGATPADGFSLAHVMMMLLIDTFLYLTLAWYIEKVRPGTLGLPQPFYFPLMPSYWLGTRDNLDDCDSKAEALDAERKNHKLECYEAPPGELDIVVRIRDLVKTFKGGKRALKGINLDMHKGTILGLLGHNGAGKTTTMSILTGLYAPTSGDIKVNGKSVRKDSQGVRRQLGVCLQHNALYEQITVEEHLSLFCCLKSVPYSILKDTVDGLLVDTGLTNKRHAASRALSGGMKRKLSIGIALSGGPEVVTLDEPTAGVDANSRRDIWQLLAAQKTHRTILLSTHFMDEADILSDRIAIIAEGQLTAIGSGIHLKHHFADSYMLTLVVVDDADARRLSLAIQSSVPEAKFAGSRGRELSFSLPGSARGRFAELFAKLQDAQMRENLGIDTYGLSAASMEEVFLQASSTHEEGLAGTIRNSVPSAEPVLTPRLEQSPSSDEVSTTSGSSSGKANSQSSNSGSNMDRTGTSSSDIAKQPSDELDATNTIDLAKEPSGEKDFAEQPSEESGPRSPHSMVVNDPPKQPQHDPPKFDEIAKLDKIKLKVKASDADAQLVDKSPRGEAFEREAVKLWHGPNLWRQQFFALLRKRGLSVRRDRMAWCSQLLLPAVFVLIALVLAAMLTTKEEEPPLKLSSDMFIGTTQAGSVASSLDEHVIPFGSSFKGAMEQDLTLAFTKAKGDGDVLREVPYGAGFAHDNMSDYLLTNQQALLTQSYGAIELAGVAEHPNITMWFRTRAYHAVPVFTNLFNNARLRLLGFDDTKIEAWSHPLPKSQVVMEEELTGGNQLFIDLTVAITVILAMGFIPASFVVYLVHEKSSSGKHQQLLTGVSPTMYWLSSYCWDMINYLCPLIVCTLIFVVFTVEAYSGRNLGAIVFLLLSYGICMTPCMYCLEPFFSVPSTAYVTLICVNIFTGTVSVMATAVLDLVQNDEPDLKPINDVCKAIFPWLLPNYSLGRGMIDIASNHYMNYAYDEFGVCVHEGGKVCIRDPMVYDVVGKYLLDLFIMTPVWLGLRMFIEWGCCLRQLRKQQALNQGVQSCRSEDEAVNKEADRISAEVTAGSAKDCLVLSNLAKSFAKTRGCCCRKRAPATHAVRGLNVGVPNGECFGLLGVNGAGKTTTMRMITGDTDIGGGDITVCGHSVQNNRDRARWHLGYCPQFDALPDKLTVRETLALYARIRGVPGDAVLSTVESMVKRMCLEAHQNNTCEHLSGGNKRKLSTALSLIGEPDVVLLDEPSTGVDVGARRFLWDVIGDIRRRGHALVLTSHSMEECEVLCTRLTIMVNGQLRCLGSPTQLKAKYGGGYTLMVKAILSKDIDSCARIRKFIAANIPEAALAEESVGLFRYGLGGRGSNEVADGEVPLANIFQTFEQATKEGGELEGCVSDYTLSQTSLEEVFLHFSQEAVAPGEQSSTQGESFAHGVVEAALKLQ